MAIVRISTGAVILLFLPLLLSNVAQAFGSIGGPHPTIFNVLKYGASPDGKKESTQAFMQAWVAACHSKGNARLLVPQGTFLVGPVIFQGPCSSPMMVVQVQGTVKATTDISEYDEDHWFLFENINGLTVTGGGTFDGQGASSWEYNDCHSNPDCTMLPIGLKFMHVTRGIVRQVNSLNPAGFHIVINNCDDFKAHSLHITAPKTSPNTDGIHVSESNNIRISRSIIATGDDCVSIGQGATNVSVSKVTCGPGHGISIGSLGKKPDEKDVRGVIVRNCTLIGTENGVRIKTWPASPPTKASHFIFQDIIMDNVKNPIIIDQSYCAGSSCNKKPSLVAISDVHYRNIRGTSSSNVAVSVGCSSQVHCQNVDMINIDLKYTGLKAGVQASSTCANAKVNFWGTQNPPPCRAVA
ncbi:Glycoside hydrolase [Macleaya cordata]|uniref:Glycoside hydrolase n=1 Tax=Macleaya cordata TaxID=56857 RepID=A0A200PWR2_MACCD|nr:Glycoside hydrolase [Macleaya cordata]